MTMHRYRTGTREVSTIKSNEFLKNLYRYLDNQRNQGTYVIQFFNAAGSRYFEMPLSYAKRTNDALEAERQYVKNRSLTAGNSYLMKKAAAKKQRYEGENQWTIRSTTR